MNVSKKALYSKFEENLCENITSNAAIRELSTHTKMLSDTCSHILVTKGNAQETGFSLACLIKVKFRVFPVLADPWQHIENTVLQHTRKSGENMLDAEKLVSNITVLTSSGKH